MGMGDLFLAVLWIVIIAGALLVTAGLFVRGLVTTREADGEGSPPPLSGTARPSNNDP